MAAAAQTCAPVTLRVGWGQRGPHRLQPPLPDEGRLGPHQPRRRQPGDQPRGRPHGPRRGRAVHRDDEGLQAVLVNFACHLDVLGNGNFLFSADYPYYLRQTLQAAYGRSLVIPFANGPCGNINHINVFANKRQGGYDHARMMGMMLAGEVLKIERERRAARGGGDLAAGRGCWTCRAARTPRRSWRSSAQLLADDRIPDRAYPKIRARTHLRAARAGRGGRADRGADAAAGRPGAVRRARASTSSSTACSCASARLPAHLRRGAGQRLHRLRAHAGGLRRGRLRGHQRPLRPRHRRPIMAEAVLEML